MSRDWRLAVAVCVAAGAARLLIGALTPLFPDETYYWEWSRRLAAGYFDHPPIIAWLIAGGTSLFGATPIGVRFLPVLAGALGTLFIAAAARRIGGDRAALIAAVALAVMPLSAAGLVLATPDAPLLAAVAAAVFGIARALEQPPGSRESLRWWCVTGVALGLALASKYTAVLLPVGVFVAFALKRELRARLREAGPYAATAIALLVFSPVIYWNATHDWASFAFQLQHGLAAVGGSIVKRELDLLGGQLGLVTPVLFVMSAIAVARAARLPSGAAPVFAIAALVIFGFFMYSATKRRVEANWPALAYLPAIALMAAYPGARRWSRWLTGGVVFAAALTAVAWVNAFVPILPVPARRDPAARAWGWNDLAAEVGASYVPRLSVSSYRTWVAADRYQDASELAFHLPDNPQTFSLNLGGRTNQYGLWPGFADRAQPRDALILVLDYSDDPHPTAALLAPHFEEMRGGERVALARDGDVVKVFRLWHFERWRGTWPE